MLTYQEGGTPLYEESPPETLRCKNLKMQENLVSEAKLRFSSVDRLASNLMLIGYF